MGVDLRLLKSYIPLMETTAYKTKNILEGATGLKPVLDVLEIAYGKIAECVRKDRVWIGRIISGKASPSLRLLRQLSLLLCCTADDLLSVPTEQRLREIKAAYLRRAADQAEAEAQEVA